MASFNKVLLMGHITRDLELKYMPNQTAVCDFGLAINRNWTGQDGVKKEEVTFVDCSCFGKTAEILSKYKKKGDPLFVEGRLKLDQWEAQDGTKRQKLRVIVESFQFLNRAQQSDQGYAGEPAESTPPRPSPHRPPASQQQGSGRLTRPSAASKILDVPPDGGVGDLDDLPPLRDEDIPF